MNTDINKRLNTLFSEWIEESQKNAEAVDDTNEHNVIFTRDGILEKNDPYINVEREWLEFPKRIAFLLKDQPSLYSDDLRYWLKDMPTDNEEARTRKEDNRELTSQFLHNLANVFWGLNKANAENECSLEDASFQEVKEYFNTKPFAFIECKKQGGGVSIEDNVLKEYLHKYGHLLIRELNILQPNMIVCTSQHIYGYILQQYPEEELITFGKKHNSIRYHAKSKTLIFCSFHPSARISYENFYEGVMDHYRTFLNSEYASDLL